ncbi:hypothetical protein [Longimicrobium sp.]|uniref:hypothetical protein n=1 Tax=Longimicrobium sp. TaxID=2029185 RepID=UPI003B3AC810
MTKPSVRWPFVMLAVSVAAAGACATDSPAPTHALSPPPDIERYVTGAAAAALGADGLFPDAEPAPRERPMISRARAKALALGYVNSYGQFLEPSWEERRGAPINLKVLQASPRVHYAESPYGAFPEGPYHPAFRREFGPYYLVTLTDGNAPVLLVAVSAFNTDVGLDERGQVHETPLGGNEFVSTAIPRDPKGYRMPGAEQAVERVALMTGARANGPPELLQRPRWHPAAALWKIPLDRVVRVRVRRTSAPAMADALYIDGGGRSFVPSAEQPDAEVRDLVIGPPWGRGARTMQARIPVAPGRATRFEEVTVESS